MYTVAEVARKTKSSTAEVRYFARKYTIPKITIDNTPVFIFGKKEYRLFLFYKNKYKPKESPLQLTFDFYNQTAIIKKQNVKSAKQKRKEKELIKKMCTLLQKVGEAGIERVFLEKKLKLDKYALEKLLAKCTRLPIAEDDRIDNKLYWVGNENDIIQMLYRSFER